MGRGPVLASYAPPSALNRVDEKELTALWFQPTRQIPSTGYCPVCPAADNRRRIPQSGAKDNPQIAVDTEISGFREAARPSGARRRLSRQVAESRARSPLKNSSRLPRRLADGRLLQRAATGG